MSAFRRRKVRSSKTLGQRFKAARIRKKFKLEEVEDATKIRLRYLKAMEEDDYRKLPSDVYLSGFLANYAEYLGLPPREILEQYKTERRTVTKLTQGKSFRATGELRELGYAITPRTLIIIIIIIGVLCLFGYIGWQVERFSSPPPVEVMAPTTDVTNANSTVVRGRTAETAEVSINGQKISVDSDGVFVQEVGLKRGVNAIEIKATNRIGKATTKTIKIFADITVPASPAGQP